jgi:hypothetical protein
MATFEHVAVYLHVPVGSPPQGETTPQAPPLLPASLPQLDAAAAQTMSATHPQRDPFTFVLIGGRD